MAKPKPYPLVGFIVISIAVISIAAIISAQGISLDTRSKAKQPNRPGKPGKPVFTEYTMVAIKDPFYPDLAYRRFPLPTSQLPYYYPMNQYTITSKDPNVGNKSVTFFAAGYTGCTDKLEMGLPYGFIPGGPSYVVCSSPTSTLHKFTFPKNPVTTSYSVLDSPVEISSDGNLIGTYYVPLSWWTQ
jgi:hypothetical protein